MIKLPSYLTGFSSKSDGSAGIRFATQELTASDFALLKEHLNQFGWLLFSESGSEKDIPDEDPEEEGISSSERLMRRMYVFWEKKVKKPEQSKSEFDLWRRKQLELLGERYLEKLE